MPDLRLLEDGSVRLLEGGSSRLLEAGDPPPVPTPVPAVGAAIEVFALPDMASLGTQPVTTFGVSGQRELSGTGFGQFSVALDDPAAGVIVPGLHVGAIRRTPPGGSAATVLTFEIEEVDEHTIDEQGGARQVATFKGRGSAVGLDRVKVWPSMGHRSLPKEIDAVHDWRRYQFDIVASGWVAATEICTVAAASDISSGEGNGLWPTQPMGDDFTFATGAYMIWSSDGTTTVADPGWALFVLDVEIDPGGRHGVEVLMDNDGFFWIDTVQMLEVNQFDGYHRVSFKRVENLTTGWHRFSFAVRNIAGNGPNPGALAFNLFKVDQQDRPQRDDSNQELPPIAISDSQVRVLHVGNDPWPGWNVGEILLEHWTTGVDRNLATWFDLDFTASVDSNGDPWPAIDPGYVTKTGHTSVLGVLDELTAEGLVSMWRVLPDGVTLQVFAPGYTEASGATLEPSPVADPTTGQIRVHDRRRT